MFWSPFTFIVCTKTVETLFKISSLLFNKSYWFGNGNVVNGEWVNDDRIFEMTDILSNLCISYQSILFPWLFSLNLSGGS